MSGIDRLVGDTDWIDLDFIERGRSPESIIEVGIQLHLAVLSLSNTEQHIEILGVNCGRTAIHNWVNKAELQPTTKRNPQQVAVDETVVQVSDECRWLYAAVDPETNEFLHIRLFPTRTTFSTVLFLHELRHEQHLNVATILVDAAPYLTAALDRLELSSRIRRYGYRSSVERIPKQVNRRASSFSNTFSSAEPTTADRGSKPSLSGGVDAKVTRPVGCSRLWTTQGHIKKRCS